VIKKLFTGKKNRAREKNLAGKKMSRREKKN
jgi:hypothetical protein